MAEENDKQKTTRQDDSKLNITLHLYDTDMAVKVYRDEEEYYRNAAKLISDVMNTYASLLRGKRSEKQILYAAMLDIALRYQKEAKRNDTAPISNILGKLTSEIEEALK